MRRSSWPPRSPTGWAVAAAVAVLVALAAFALLSYALSREPGVDVAAYWNAAERLRDGETLYAGGAANASDLYRYAPWFAAAWIPLTYLPREAVTISWVVLMIAAALLSTLPLLRRGPTGWAAFAILAPLQLIGAAFGNVQPLLVLVLMHGVERRSGPFWIALGASLKAVPLLLALVYAGRGEWRRAALALGLTVLLVAPAFLFDISGYSTEPGPNQMSLAGVSLLLWLPVALAAMGATWALARTRFGWVAASVALLAALPRLLVYEGGFLLIGLAQRRRS
ncbi:MAG: glycosyltransferase 87 family protein [Chloroflexota bacterium]|nr:glycosyltransferase 87 family protein [Chloroflexota bacterium]